MTVLDIAAADVRYHDTQLLASLSVRLQTCTPARYNDLARDCIDLAIAMGTTSVCMSICHSGDARLNGSRYETWFAPYDRVMIAKNILPELKQQRFQACQITYSHISPSSKLHRVRRTMRCTKSTKTRSSAIADKPTDACARHAVLSRAAIR